LSPHPSPRTGFKAAAAAVGAVVALSSGIAFAASGHLPGTNGAAHASAAATDHTAPTHPTHPAHPTHPSDPASSDGSESGGPSVNAYQGLCRAYAAGQKATHGKALQAKPFLALVTAAGGVDNVSTFCSSLPSPTEPTETEGSEDATPPTHPVHPVHPVHPTQAASPTHPTHPTHPAHPTQAPTQTHSPNPHSGS
jgi:hypothetical protein